MPFVGHRNSYEKGVLHRDISLGNIIITGNSERGRRGALIDYNNAIFREDHQAVTDDPLSVWFLLVLFSSLFLTGLLGYPAIHVLGDIGQRTHLL